MQVPYQQLIERAVKAPSGHNTQPWKFKTEENRIIIYPDYNRSLPVVDSDNHALFISLGCALENLVIAAEYNGLTASIAIDTEQEKKESISVTFIPSASNEKNTALYNFIDVRQATRNMYNGKPIPSSDLEKLKTASQQKDVQTVLLADEIDREAIIDLVKEANRLQFKNPSFIAELIRWIRFNKNSAVKTGDGLFGAATGNPSVPTWFGKLFMKLSANPEKEANKWDERIHSSAALMLFIAERNDKTAWINVGRSFERTMLKAASLNINHAHVNMPCEEVEVRKKLSRLLNLTEQQQPMLLIRLGYSEKMPYSFRRPLEDVILN